MDATTQNLPEFPISQGILDFEYGDWRDGCEITPLNQFGPQQSPEDELRSSFANQFQGKDQPSIHKF